MRSGLGDNPRWFDIRLLGRWLAKSECKLNSCLSQSGDDGTLLLTISSTVSINDTNCVGIGLDNPGYGVD